MLQRDLSIGPGMSEKARPLMVICSLESLYQGLVVLSTLEVNAEHI